MRFPALILLVALGCGREETQVGAEWIYIEAESGELAGGFVVRTDPVASGGQYIEYIPPPDGGASQDSTQQPGGASASYSFQLVRAGAYYVWGRMHGPDPRRGAGGVVTKNAGGYDLWSHGADVTDPTDDITNWTN